MTKEQALALDNNSPVLLADGSMGLLILWFDQSVGVQVYGEDAAREIPIDRLVDIGGGALVEIPA